jgi:hypothetical protein
MSGIAEGFHLQAEAGTCAAGDGEMAGKSSANGHADCGKLILSLHINAAVFGQFGTQCFHDG